MKKYLLMTTMMLWAAGAAAATGTQGKQPEAAPEPCQYTLLQNLVRDARSHERVFELIKAGVSMDDETITCGGSLLQLAIRRGNPSIVNGILTQDKSRANAKVSLKDFRIPGAPEAIPVILFAAYYAPSEVVFRVMVEGGADVTVRDEKGHNILWYLNRNPVLRRTKVEDEVQAALQQRLLEQARRKNTEGAAAIAVPNPELKAVDEDTVFIDSPE